MEQTSVDNIIFVIVKILHGEVHCRQYAYHILFMVIRFILDIIIGTSTTAEDIVIEKGSLKMGSMEDTRLEVEVMGKAEQVKP